jgi:DNA-binding transcriptional LysR family regulator
MSDFRLEVFYTVAKRLSFTKAAAELFITQPGVSRHIQELEEQYKTKLFERNGNKIQLTAAGKLLYQQTELLFAIYRNIDFEMNALTQRKNGLLRLGASTTIAQYVIPPLLAGFRQKFADVKVNLITGNTEQIEAAILNKDIELGIIEGHSKNQSIKYTSFLKDEIVLVSNSKNPDAKKDEIKPEDLKKIPLLLREQGSGTLEVIEHALKPLKIKLSQLNIEMHLGSTESIKSYLMHSRCMAFLSIHAVQKELQSGELRIIDIKGWQIERFFYFIHLQGKAEALPEMFMRYAQHHHNLK